MRIGPLDRRVAVQKKTKSRDPATGEELATWATTMTLWMGKRDARAAERFASEQNLAEIHTVFEARWSPALVRLRADTHRLVYRGRVYEIHGVTELGRGEACEIATVARGEARFGD